MWIALTWNRNYRKDTELYDSTLLGLGLNLVLFASSTIVESGP